MRKYSIVIVENDEDERIFITEAFNKNEHFELLQVCNNGNTLVEWLNANTGSLPDLVLSDLNMPGMNGYDIIEFIKQDPRFSNIPVIITSTSSTPGFIEKCLAIGASSYIPKPHLFIEYDAFADQLYESLEQVLVSKK
jgi:CheY-like chemotaxis protein